MKSVFVVAWRGGTIGALLSSYRIIAVRKELFSAFGGSFPPQSRASVATYHSAPAAGEAGVEEGLTAIVTWPDHSTEMAALSVSTSAR